MEKGDNVTSMRLETDSDGDETVERSKLKPLSVTVHCSNALRERVHKIENNEKETENSKAYYIHALIESSPVDTCCLEQGTGGVEWCLPDDGILDEQRNSCKR